MPYVSQVHNALSYLPKLAGFVCQRAYETPAGGLFRCWRFRCRFDGIGERMGSQNRVTDGKRKCHLSRTSVAKR